MRGMRVVIAFDVADDKVRYRVVRTLKEYAVRVQKSVFEAAELPKASYLRMRSRLEGLVSRETDSLRYYMICGSCGARTEWFGVGPGHVDRDEDAEVIA